MGQIDDFLRQFGNVVPPEPPVQPPEMDEGLLWRKFFNTHLPSLMNETPWENMEIADKARDMGNYTTHEPYPGGGSTRDIEQRYYASPIGSQNYDTMSGISTGYGWELDNNLKLYDMGRDPTQDNPIHESRINPPFQKSHGGYYLPTDVSDEPTQGGRIGEYLKKVGVPPAITDRYSVAKTNFGQVQNGLMGYFGGEKDILLSGIQNVKDPWSIIQPAQHEGVHSYDGENKVNESPEFRQAVADSKTLYPEMSSYMGKVPPGDPAYYAHVLTAAIDQGLTIDELPPPLRPFYKDLIPQRPIATRFSNGLNGR